MDFLSGIFHGNLLDRILAVIAIIAGVVAIYYERRLHRLFQIQRDALQARFEDLDRLFQVQRTSIQKSFGDLHQLFQSQRAAIAQKFEAQRDSIEQIVLSVHTSYIGNFPQDLEKATELIRSTKDDDDLNILVDFLGYGSYSDPEKYEKYVSALKDSKARVRILVYGEEEAKSSIRIQFKEEDYEQVRNTDKMSKYLDHHQKRIKKVPTCYYEFLNTLFLIQDQFCTELTVKKHIDVRTVSGRVMPEAVFYWMIPKKEMIFSFPNSYTQKKEFSFKTRDDHLLESFIYQFEIKWENGTDVRDRCYASSPVFPLPAAGEAAKP